MTDIVRGTVGVRISDDAGDKLNINADGSINVVGAGGGGGTQYTEDVASVADPVGGQLIARRRDTPAAEVSTDGDAVALNATNKGELYVKSNDPISVTGLTFTGPALQVTGGGGGTEYAEDAASVADPLGQQLMARRRDTLAVETSTDGDNTALNSTGKGELYVKHVDSIPVTGTFFQATQPVSATNLDVALSTRLKPADTLAAVTTVGTITNVVHVDDNAGSLTIDSANLDVALSTRLKPADTLTAVTTVGTITNVVHVDDNAGSLTVDGTVAISGSVAVTGPVTDAQLRATPVPVSGTVTANQGGAPWAENVTQFGGSAVATGVGSSGAGVPRVTVSAEDTVTTGALNALNATLVVNCTGKAGVGGEIQAGTLAGTLLFQTSFDGGVTYTTAIIFYAGVQQSGTVVLTNPNARATFDFIVSEGVSHARITVSAFTSGTATGWIRATNIVSPVAVGALPVGIVGTALPLFGSQIGYKAATALPAATTAGLMVTPFVDGIGRQITRPWTTFHINSQPVVATTASASRASGGAGVKNVCTAISISLTSTAAPTAGSVIFNLRDGATGAGTVLWTIRLSIAAVAGECASFAISDLWIEGTAATAMTLETSAAPAAGTFASVSWSGTLTV